METQAIHRDRTVQAVGNQMGLRKFECRTWSKKKMVGLLGFPENPKIHERVQRSVDFLSVPENQQRSVDVGCFCVLGE